MAKTPLPVKTAKGETPKGEKPPEREIPQAEQDAVKKLLARIERAKTISKTFNETTLPKLRRYSWGTKHGEQGSSDPTTARTNLIFATMATLLPHIYAKNPEIAASPTEAVGDDEYDKIKDFCKTCQVMLNNLLIEEAQMKRRQKANIRSSMSTSVGWLKMGFQESLRADPIILGRVNDIQDNLRRVEYLIAENKTEKDITTLNQNREELQLQLKTIMGGPEMKIFKGFVLDRVKTEDMFILDESIVEFDDYASADAMAHRVWMVDDKYKEMFGDVPTGATSYGQPATGDVNDETGQKIQMPDNAKETYRAVFEVWDKTTNTVCCVVEGAKGYCKAPRTITPASERWYPFYALGFNIVEGRWRPISDVELLMKLQDEYNTTRFLYAETRKEAIPTRVFRKAGNLTEEDIKSLANRRSRDWIGIEGNPTVALTQDIMQLEGVKIDPQAFDVTLIRNDMDMLVGLSDASRANLIQAKTATEAEIMKQALQNRVEERQDAVEDMTSEMANAALQIMLQKFNLDEVKTFVGEGAVWPEITEKEEIFRKIRISVRAGSSGKPNMTQERESWAQIMPIINDTITQVMELRMQGQHDLAQSKIELLKETLRRYDEKIDVDQFIPKEEMGPDGKPVAQANAIAQSQQLQEQFQKTSQELEQTKQQLVAMNQQLLEARQGEQAKIADIESRKAIALAQASAKEQELRTKQAEAEATAAGAAAKEQRLLDEKKYALDKDAETTKYKLDREKETAIAIQEMKCECEVNVAKAANQNKLDVAKQGSDDQAKAQEHEKGMQQTEAATQDKAAKSSDGAASAISAAAKSLEKAAQAVAEAASMDRVPEYDKEGKIVRVTARKSGKETVQ